MTESRNLALLLAAASAAACSSSTPTPPSARDWPCEIQSAGAAPDSLSKIGCAADFEALASQPLDASIPGARSGKVILDLLPAEKPLYFQNSQKYPIHY